MITDWIINCGRKKDLKRKIFKLVQYGTVKQTLQRAVWVINCVRFFHRAKESRTRRRSRKEMKQLKAGSAWDLEMNIRCEIGGAARARHQSHACYEGQL